MTIRSIPDREVVPLASLRPHPRNYRGHPDAQLDHIAQSIRANGVYRNVVVARDGTILAGHGVVLAARMAGLDSIPVVRLDLDPEDVRALKVLAGDNESARLAEDDDRRLAELLRQVRDEDDSGLLGTGFDDAALGEFLDAIRDPADNPGDRPEDPGASVDRADEMQAKWGVAPADLWLIPSMSVPGGDHRLLCGDSTNPSDVARVMAGDKARLMNTDPPYGINYAACKDGIPVSGYSNIREIRGDIENDDLTDGPALQAFLELAIRAAVPHLVENPAFYLWHPMLTQGTFFAAAAAAAADILIHRQIIWVKPHFVLTRSGMYHWRHELCFYGWIRGKMPPWHGDKSQTSVWEVGRDGDAGLHLTQKPVELFARPILNHTRPGESVYEPFAGSGSQFVAAEQAGRLARGLEIAPRYCAVALERLAGLGLSPRKAASAINAA